MTILFVILLILLARKVLDFAVYIANGDMNGAVMQIAGWLAGVLAVYLAIWSNSNWNDISIDAGPRVLYGILAGSAASTVHDYRTALARRDPRPGLLRRVPPVQ